MRRRGRRDERRNGGARESREMSNVETSMRSIRAAHESKFYRLQTLFSFDGAFDGPESVTGKLDHHRALRMGTHLLVDELYIAEDPVMNTRGVSSDRKGQRHCPWSCR